VAEVQGIEGKLVTALCSHKGRLLNLLAQKGSKLELTPQECSLVYNLSEFSNQFGEFEYCQYDLGNTVKETFCFGK